jgi:hypothetical protein
MILEKGQGFDPADLCAIRFCSNDFQQLLSGCPWQMSGAFACCDHHAGHLPGIIRTKTDRT